MAEELLPLAFAARLTRYLQILSQTQRTGAGSISSKVLSEFSDINPTQIRRDLASFGRFGKRGVGYDVDHLVDRLKQILHASDPHSVALLGWGNLGEAIAGSDVYADHGFEIAAIFDVDPAKIGQRAGDLAVQHVSELNDTVRRKDLIAGILAVPSRNASAAAKSLIDAEVKVIFNYSEALLPAPPGVSIHSMSPASELLFAMYNHLR